MTELKVTVKVYANLREYTNGKGTLEVKIPEDATTHLLIEKLGIPEDEVKLIMVNGRRKKPDATIQDGDRIGIFPPIAGG